MQYVICKPYSIIAHFVSRTQITYCQHLLRCCMWEGVSWIAIKFTNEPMKHVGIKFESFVLRIFFWMLHSLVDHDAINSILFLSKCTYFQITTSEYVSLKKLQWSCTSTLELFGHGN